MKETYIVAWATYNRNESADALQCGVFRDTFPSEEEARKAALRQIQREAEEDMADGGYQGETLAEVVEGRIWRDAPGQICEEHGGIESVYTIERR